VLGALAYGLAGGFNIRGGARPPLFETPGAVAVARLRELVSAATVPDQYRSIFNPRAIEAAAAGGRPLMWLAAVAALAYAVTR
jgi:hypothetical protein